MSWNGYPSYVRNSILKKLKDRKKHSEKRPTNFEHEDIPRIWFRIPYIGLTGEKLAKSCIAKLRRNCKKDVRFVLMYDTKKVSFFCSNKDPVPNYLQSHLIYQFEYPGCKAKYIEKTDRCLDLRLNEHSDFHTSAVGKHLYECEHFQHLIDLFTTDVRQPWTNYVNNGNKHLIVGADVRSEYSNIRYLQLIIGKAQKFASGDKYDF